jgi:hypothetical protein
MPAAVRITIQMLTQETERSEARILRGLRCAQQREPRLANLLNKGVCKRARRQHEREAPVGTALAAGVKSDVLD